MKKFLLFLVSLLAGVGLFVWILKIVGRNGLEEAFLVFKSWRGLVILALTILIAVVGNWRWKEILKGMDVNISFRELFRPFLAGFSLIYLFPVIVWGGEIFRGYFLKEKKLIPWSKGMASVIIDRVFEWTANLVFIFLGGLFFLFIIGFPSLKLGIIFGGVFLFFLAAVSFFYFKCIKKESMMKFFFLGDKKQPLEIEKEIFGFFKLKKIAMWKSLFLSFLRATCMCGRVWFLILFLGKEISALPSLSILGFSYLAAMIPIPTSLGSHEVIQAFAFNSLGLGASTATAFTMVIRGAELIVALFGLMVLFRLGTILLKDNLFKKLNNFSKINKT